MLTLTAEASLPHLSAIDSPQIIYLLADIRPPKSYAEQRLPLNVCLVIDRSTSMKETRLARVKSAATRLIEQLAPEDVLSIVSFSDRADVVLEAEPVHNKGQAMGRLNGIQASGGTEIFQGLAAGVGELHKAADKEHLSHLILLTDGHTYGDADECLAIASKAAAIGIGFSAFGIGTEWNDEFLDELVAPSGGRSAYIASPEEIVAFLQERIQGLGSVFARNIGLTLECPIGVELQEVFKVAPFAQPLTAKKMPVAVGSIEGHSPITLLLSILFPPLTAGAELLLELRVQADIPSMGIQGESVTAGITLTAVEPDDKADPPEMSPTMVEAVRNLNIYRMHEQVWQEVEAGKVQAATRRMNFLATRLLEAGHVQLAEQAEAETRRLATMGTMSVDGRKKIKYGTRSLMTQSLHLQRSKTGDLA